MIFYRSPTKAAAQTFSNSADAEAAVKSYHGIFPSPEHQYVMTDHDLFHVQFLDDEGGWLAFCPDENC
jgi:hypothetical protein